jgi:hypothetical protein
MVCCSTSVSLFYCHMIFLFAFLVARRQVDEQGMGCVARLRSATSGTAVPSESMPVDADGAMQMAPGMC